MTRTIVYTCLIGSILLSGCYQRPQAIVAGVLTPPPISLRLMDSVTIFNISNMPINTPAVLIYFSPDCEHCQKEIKGIIDNEGKIAQVSVIMLSPQSFEEIRSFYRLFKLSEYNNITVGYDSQYAFYKYFKAQAFPYTVIYNKNRELIRIYDQEVDVNKIVNNVLIQ